MKKTVIITSYIENSLNLGEFIDSDDFVICTDGGYDIASRSGIIPDLIMGDFDSVTSPLPDNIRAIEFSPEKDFTDLDLALKFSAENNFSDVIIAGGIGGRLDHTVANLQLLSRYCCSFSSLIMLDGRNKCFVVDSRKRSTIVIPAEENSYLSFFSLSEKCTGVTLRGVKYTLDRYTLTQDFPLGVSNEFIKKEAVVSIENGTLLVVISKK